MRWYVYWKKTKQWFSFAWTLIYLQTGQTQEYVIIFLISFISFVSMHQLLHFSKVTKVKLLLPSCCSRSQHFQEALGMRTPSNESFYLILPANKFCVSVSDHQKSPTFSTGDGWWIQHLSSSSPAMLVLNIQTLKM